MVGASLFLVALAISAGVGKEGDELSAADRAYLRQLAVDTWHSIAGMAHPKTGLPYDNSKHGEFTSVSNVGVYLTSVVAARELKLITPEEARQRLEKALSSFEKFKTTFGFQQSWNSVENLAPASHDAWISVLDTGNLCGGLVTVSQACPEFKERCKKLLKAMEWDKFWAKEQKALLGGYNVAKKEYNLKWHVDAIGTDALLAQFFAVASGAAPVSFWESLNRKQETKYKLSYYWPGWQGGGLFMQFVSGLWLDVKGTPFAMSSRNFALAQIKHASEIKSPVWGWSACDDPAGGYLGWGGLKDAVVTPHACVLALGFFPKECVKNLRELEALGVRSAADGFYDSYDWTTKKRSEVFLVFDQGMLFLSLANYLEGDCVRKWFQKDAVVQKGRALIPEFRSAK
jgi:hypothetical protein